MGSDWGVSTANVMRQIDIAINRACAGREALGPGQALTPSQSLTAFTSGSAYINGIETDVGMLRPGMRADLAVMDADPLGEGTFAGTEVAMTFASGRVVFEA